jgi:hypothetical protein
VPGNARDNYLFALGVTLVALQVVGYYVLEIKPNIGFLVVSVGCLLGSTVLSRALDGLLGGLIAALSAAKRNGHGK